MLKKLSGKNTTFFLVSNTYLTFFRIRFFKTDFLSIETNEKNIKNEYN